MVAKSAVSTGVVAAFVAPIVVELKKRHQRAHLFSSLQCFVNIAKRYIAYNIISINEKIELTNALQKLNVDALRNRIMMDTREHGINHYILLAGTCENLKKGMNLSMGKRLRLSQTLPEIRHNRNVGYWAVASHGKQQCKSFNQTARPENVLWFVQKANNEAGIQAGKVFAVAELVIVRNQRTFTSEEMNWNSHGGECSAEVVYTNCVSLENCNIHIETSGQSLGPKTVRQYKTNGKITTDLYKKYEDIQMCKNAQYM